MCVYVADFVPRLYGGVSGVSVSICVRILKRVHRRRWREYAIYTYVYYIHAHSVYFCAVRHTDPAHACVFLRISLAAATAAALAGLVHVGSGAMCAEQDDEAMAKCGCVYKNVFSYYIECVILLNRMSMNKYIYIYIYIHIYIYVYVYIYICKCKCILFRVQGNGGLFEHCRWISMCR